MRIPPLRRGLGAALFGMCLLAPATPLQAQRSQEEARRVLTEAQAARKQANTRGAESQQRITDLVQETDALYSRWQSASAQLEALLKFNGELSAVIAQQEERIEHLTRELDQVDEVARSVTPLMYRMIDALDKFIALDLPFLAEERAERVTDLRHLMSRADVTVSEKYRQIMEAYQIENEYGRTIEAYRAPLAGGEIVDFLRFGRIALLWMSLDGSEAGAWDPEARSWTDLDADFLEDVRYGLRVARQQIPPDLVDLPLPAPAQPGSEG